MRSLRILIGVVLLVAASFGGFVLTGDMLAATDPAAGNRPATPSRIISRSCSSIETPFCAASWRRRSLTELSRFLTVMLAM